MIFGWHSQAGTKDLGKARRFGWQFRRGAGERFGWRFTIRGGREDSLVAISNLGGNLKEVRDRVWVAI